MSRFKEYRRTNIAEMRPITPQEIKLGRLIMAKTHERIPISISEPDLRNGSPKAGDMVARNPKNHEDQWLVAKKYFEENFEEIPKLTKD